VRWFWRKNQKKKISVFLLFRYYLPLEKGYLLHLKKLKSPLPKDDLCQIWLKLAQWFWRRRFLDDPTPFLHFCDYFPFEDIFASQGFSVHSAPGVDRKDLANEDALKRTWPFI
jgi:hypothetical protein